MANSRRSSWAEEPLEGGRVLYGLHVAAYGLRSAVGSDRLTLPDIVARCRDLDAGVSGLLAGTVDVRGFGVVAGRDLAAYDPRIGDRFTWWNHAYRPGPVVAMLHATRAILPFVTRPGPGLTRPQLHTLFDDLELVPMTLLHDGPLAAGAVLASMGRGSPPFTRAAAVFDAVLRSRAEPGGSGNTR